MDGRSLGGCVLFKNEKKHNENKELELKKDETEYVRRECVEQLRPHFIFNSMNVIRYLIQTDPGLAYKEMYELSQFMRGLLEKVYPSGLIPLKEELKYVRSYMELEKIQKKYLVVKWDIKDESGYVPCGSVSDAIAGMFRRDQEMSSQVRTILIEDNEEECKLQVSIRETGAHEGIPIKIEGD